MATGKTKKTKIFFFVSKASRPTWRRALNFSPFFSGIVRSFFTFLFSGLVHGKKAQQKKRYANAANDH
jgi:hypothetical protein